jgi:hypothetical protein
MSLSCNLCTMIDIVGISRFGSVDGIDLVNAWKVVGMEVGDIMDLCLL